MQKSLKYIVKKIAFLVLCPLLFTSCFEVREELTLNYDGSGTYRLVLDFSASKGLLQQVLEIEKKRGQPTKASRLEQFLGGAFARGANDIKDIPGIRNPSAIRGADSLQFGYAFQFETIGSLNQALALNNLDSSTVFIDPYYQYRKGKLKRTDAFYLKKLFEGIQAELDKFRDASIAQGQGVMHPLDSIFGSASYRLAFSGSGKIKKIKSALPDSLLHTVSERAFHASLSFLNLKESRNNDWSFDLKMKNR